MKFFTPKTVITANALNTLAQEDVYRALEKHFGGNWGVISKDDWEANERALVEGTRLLSAYVDRRGTRFWIITEADRASTCVLLPDDY